MIKRIIGRVNGPRSRRGGPLEDPPDMASAHLVAEIGQRLFPNTVRIVLCGQADSRNNHRCYATALSSSVTKSCFDVTPTNLRRICPSLKSMTVGMELISSSNETS